MKTLSDIVYRTSLQEIRGNLGQEVGDFHFDSRAVGPGDLFVARKGATVDGHDYIAAAVAAGAIAVVCETIPEEAAEGVTWIRVKDSVQALAIVAANFYDNPADRLDIVGVTGTNGKTTVTSLLHRLFTNLGHPSGLIGTVAVKIGEDEVEAKMTTPDPKQLHGMFRRMVDAGCTNCFIEVSSHALVQGRVAGIRFAAAVFTNITHDHLDYHGTFAEYIKAKKLLFDGLHHSAFALTNADDKNGQVMLQNTKAEKYTYGIKRIGDYKGRIVENTFEGMLLNLNGQELWCRLIGHFNAYNLLAVYGVAIEMGLDEEGVLLELSSIEGVDGRFQAIYSDKERITAIVDYAHTPDALKNVLQTIRDISQGSRVITVVGCGGNRDKAKRPQMAEIATKMSDHVILTSDNPRDEDPRTIIDEMLAGVPVHAQRRVFVKEDRAEAIEKACEMATPDDIILVAGKGHETYQEIKGERPHFDDREVLKAKFTKLNK
ncbi:MAG: UDP-N-acetylmuramoyl-L-alanyl-D-glutamate--2,6-diaminopimelate ligase [Bacteroidota bacterium]